MQDPTGGRPRNLELTQQVVEAGTRLFAAKGWNAFTLDAVAREARVGKSSIYLRYPDREKLLVDIVTASVYRPHTAIVDHGSFSADLLALATDYATWLDSDAGLLYVRVAMEVQLDPAFSALVGDLTRERLPPIHALVRRAKKRGEVPSSASASVILNALAGGMLLQMMNRTGPREPFFSGASGRRFVRELVSCIVRGSAPTE